MSNELLEAYGYLTSLPWVKGDEVAHTAYSCMSKSEREESRALVIVAALAAGAVTIKPRGGYQVALIEFGGRSRKGHIASDCNGFQSAVGDAQRAPHERGALV